MAYKNTAERYGRIAQLFHWATAALILSLIPLGGIMHDWPDQPAASLETKIWLYSLHKTLGVTVLAIAVMRIVWALMNPKPEPLHPERRAETFAAETVHWMLYAGIIIAPLSGLLHHAASVGFAPIWWPFGQDIPFVPKSEVLSVTFGFMHWASAVLIMVSLVGHIGGALKHHFIDQDKTLTRMITGDDAIIVTPAKQGPGFNGVPAFAALIVTLLGVSIAGTYGWNQLSSARAAADQAVSVAPLKNAVNRWNVDMQQSTLGIRVNQLGSPVEGRFENWDAAIVFDPGDLDNAMAEVAINTASLSIGTVSQQATSGDFLAAETHPMASFKTSAFRALGDNRYEADGVLSIKGVERSIVLPFMLGIDGDVATMSAEATINRMDFTIGAGSYENADTVGLEVTIIIELVATKNQP